MSNQSLEPTGETQTQYVCLPGKTHIGSVGLGINLQTNAAVGGVFDREQLCESLVYIYISVCRSFRMCKQTKNPRKRVD